MDNLGDENFHDWYDGKVDNVIGRPKHDVRIESMVELHVYEYVQVLVHEQEVVHEALWRKLEYANWQCLKQMVDAQVYEEGREESALLIHCLGLVVWWQ